MSSSSKTSTVVLSIIAIVVLIAALVYFLVFSKNAQYDKAIKQADNYYTAQNYTEAKNHYEDALKIKPDADYPLQQIQDIETLIKQQEVQKKYDEAIKTADNYFNRKEYDKAREYYLMAANYKTNESYPVDQIQKIEELLAANQAEAMRNSKENYRYHIVIGSFLNGQNAEALLKKWKAKGRNSFILPRKEFDMEAVVYDSYPDIHTAYNNLDKVRNEITDDAWVIYYKQK